MAPSAIGDDQHRGRQVVRLETDGLDTLVGDFAGQPQQQHAVLRDGFGEDFCRNRVWKTLATGCRAGGAHEGVPVQPEVSQRIAVESLERDPFIRRETGKDVYVLEFVDLLGNETQHGVAGIRRTDQSVSRCARSLVRRPQ